MDNDSRPREEIGTWGGDRKSARAKENQVRNTNLKKQSDTAAYVLARLKRDREALAMLEKATQRPDGGANNPYGRKGKPEEITFDNIQGDSSVLAPTGTSRAQALRRLRQQRPDGGANNPYGRKGKPEEITVTIGDSDSTTRPRGNGRAAALRRLRQQRPDLHERAATAKAHGPKKIKFALRT